MAAVLVLLVAAGLGARPVRSAAYGSTFLGCYSEPNSDASNNLITQAQSSSEACATTCWNGGSLYSYWHGDVDLGCGCTNTSPLAGSEVEAVSTNQCDFESQWEGRVTYTTYSWTSCARYGVSDIPNAFGTIYFGGGYGDDIETCLQNCKGYTVVNAAPEVADDYDYYQCYCGTDQWGPNAQDVDYTCGATNAQLWFSHEAGTATDVSPYVKRKRHLKERLEVVEREKFAHCPKGLRACRVSGGDESAFECVDTGSELESCGGCVNGEFNGGNSTTRGIE